MVVRIPVALVVVFVTSTPPSAGQVEQPDMLARPCDVDAFVTGLAGDHLGVTLSASGDLDGDGRGDILAPTMRAFDDGTGGCESEPDNIVRVISLDGQGVPQQILQIVNVIEQSGQSITVGWVGDLNGGGKDDIAIGVPAWPIFEGECDGANRGRVFIILGESWVLRGSPAVLDAQQESDIIIHGGYTGWRFGHAVTGVGDFNGDAYDDLAIGAPGCSDPSFEGPCAGKEGKVYLFHGGPLGLSAEPEVPCDPPGPCEIPWYAADWEITGNDYRDRLGFSVARLGDFDGDGRPEFAMGAPKFHVRAGWKDAPGMPPTPIDGEHGYVVVWYSSTMSAVQIEPPPLGPDDDVACFGMSIASIGDVDGDLVPDFVVGAPATTLDSVFGAGSVFVYRGGTTPQFIAHVPPPAQSDPGRYVSTFFGWTVTALGATVNPLVDDHPDWVASAHVFSDIEIPDDGTVWDQCSTWPYAGLGGFWAGRALVMSGDRLSTPAFEKLLSIGSQDNHPTDDDRGRLSLGTAVGLIDGDSKPDLVLSAFALKNEESTGSPPAGPADNGRVYVISGTTLELEVAAAGSP
jgi:hypothetical protein